MKTTKTTKAIYRTTTAIIFLFEGLIPAFTSNTNLAIEGIRHLGYPDYFRVMLTVFKVSGALVLILPFIKGKVKEWAYAGFSITMLSAFISHLIVDDLSVQTVFPLIFFAILAASYITYQSVSKFENVNEINIKNNYVLSGITH